MGGGASQLTKAQNTELNRLMKKEFHKKFDGMSEEVVRKVLMERFEECKARVLISHPGKAQKVSKSVLYHEDSKVEQPSIDAEEEWKAMLGSYNSASDFKSKAEVAFKRAASIFSRSGTMTQLSSPKGKRGGGWDALAEPPHCDICCMAFRTKLALEKHKKFSPEHVKQVAKLEAEEAQRRELENLPANLRCNVCGITCKTLEALKRHIKYSDLHAKTLQRNASGAKNTDLVQTEPCPHSPVRVKEGPEVVLLYTGSKLFYRNNSCIDFTIYHHKRVQTGVNMSTKSCFSDDCGGCVEVIGCEVEGDCGQMREVRRIYLDYGKLLTNTEAAVETETRRRLHEITERNKGNINTSLLTDSSSISLSNDNVRSTSKLVLPDKHTLSPQIEAAITKDAVVSWIMNRLQLSVVEEGTDECELYFAQNAMDNINELPQISKPANLGLYRAHGRRTTYESDEIDEAISETNRATLKANKAVTTAEIIESKVFSREKIVFTERADSAVPVRRRRKVLTAAELDEKKRQSEKWRAKWNWAIRRVMLQNYVAAVRARVREVELIQMLRENLRAKGLMQTRIGCKSKSLQEEPPANTMTSRSNSDKSRVTEVGDFDAPNMELELEQSEDTVEWINSPLTAKVQEGSMAIQV